MINSYLRNVKRKGLLIIVFSLVWVSSHAQMLDDSKSVYGPTTTQYTSEHELMFNDTSFQIVDTANVNIHRFTRIESNNYKIQDLGAPGTALRNIYYKPPKVIGARSGFEAYQMYFKPSEDFIYYDTKSPFSRIGAAVGGEGRSKVDVSFNQSDSSNFNVGIDYRNVTTDKQYASGGRTDRLAESIGFDAYLAYYSKQRRYLILGNFSRVNHKVADQGGVDTTGGGSFSEDQLSSYLIKSKSNFKKRNYHIFHQFKIHNTLQVYQTIDRSFEEMRFQVASLSEDKKYLGNSIYFNPNATLDSTSFTTTRVESGIKGSIGKLFYKGYFKYRNYMFDYGLQDQDTVKNFKGNWVEPTGKELYFGGVASINFTKDYKLIGEIDVNLNGNQKLLGHLLGKTFDAHLTTMQYEPAIMEMAYLGNHDYWINDFETTKVLHAEGGYRFDLGDSYIRPNATFSTISDYIYYGKDSLPSQTSGVTTLNNISLDYKIKFFKNFYLHGSGTYAMVSGSDVEAFQIPEILIYTGLYHHGFYFDNNLDIQTGIDFHWKSAYYAANYRPSIQQFILQDHALVEPYPVLDVFANVKLGHAYFFTRFNNILGLLSEVTENYYLVAPNYIGKKPTFDFGFYWLFFD